VSCVNCPAAGVPRWPRHFAPWLGVLALAYASVAFAHGMAEKDAAYVTSTAGPHVFPYLYLGAKHMVTGYDHLLFLFGVIVFLRRLKDVIVYVTLFSLGHSTTLLLGVLAGLRVNSFLVDAVIGLSVVYIVFDNLGGFRTLLGFQPNTKVAVLAFGLVHGFGLATKVQELNPPADGLLPNIISFNVGVELGQLLALGIVLLIMQWWRRTTSFSRLALVAHFLALSAGFTLAGYQLAAYFHSQGWP
jgi:HupE / UreJ protein